MCCLMWIKFCRVAGVLDVITYVNTGDDQLRDLGVAVGKILPFPIGSHCCPYSTLALPCECAIDKKGLAIRALDWYFSLQL